MEAPAYMFQAQRLSERIKKSNKGKDFDKSHTVQYGDRHLSPQEYLRNVSLGNYPINLNYHTKKIENISWMFNFFKKHYFLEK